MVEQVFPVKENILYQDNKSAFLLEKMAEGVLECNLGHWIFDFFILDHLNKGIIKVKYCPIDEMIGDFMTKPFQGKKYLKFREAIMGNSFRMPRKGN